MYHENINPCWSYLALGFVHRTASQRNANSQRRKLRHKLLRCDFVQLTRFRWPFHQRSSIVLNVFHKLVCEIGSEKKCVLLLLLRRCRKKNNVDFRSQECATRFNLQVLAMCRGTGGPWELIDVLRCDVASQFYV